MHKLPNVDLSGGLIEGAVDVGALYAFCSQQLEIKTKENNINQSWCYATRKLSHKERHSWVILPFVSYLPDVLYVVSGGYKNQRLLLRFHHIPQQMKQQRLLVIHTQMEKWQLRKTGEIEIMNGMDRYEERI